MSGCLLLQGRFSSSSVGTALPLWGCKWYHDSICKVSDRISPTNHEQKKIVCQHDHRFHCKLYINIIGWGKGGTGGELFCRNLILIEVSATATCTEADGESTTTRQGFQYLYTPLLIAGELQASESVVRTSRNSVIYW